MDSANLDLAVRLAYGAIFSNAGQNCCAGSRLILHKSIYDEFLARFKAHIAANAGDVGPLISQAQMERVLDYIKQGKKAGLNLLCGGERDTSRSGYFVRPTVFTHVQDSPLLREEIFGPVLVVQSPFESLSEAIAMANNTEYGLAAAICTENIAEAETFIQRANAGTVWHNCYNAVSYYSPFGGMPGTNSGFGRDLGEDAVYAYSLQKNVFPKF